jgi:class 3 adenylate cyclase/tetratricopeptide (TPR) repeat protein
VTPAEERRWATVLFADLSGFTHLSEHMDPEDVKTMIHGCMSRMGEIAERYGAAGVRVIGDQLMAVFGAPRAREEDPERAVRAALELQRCTVEHPEVFGGLAMGVGVNTGEMMFAPVGPDRTFTLMGDAVNTASRLESAAPPGGVLVGEETWRATRKAIRYQAMEPLRLKGKEAPVRAQLALELFAEPREGLLSGAGMVGRDAELSLLLAAWERTLDDKVPQLVTVLGAPGIGKTRLRREFATRIAADGARVLVGRSLPYGTGTGFAAFSQQVQASAQILETDSAEEARRKLDARVGELVPGGESADVSTRLATLVGLGSAGAGAERGALLFAARQFVEALARQQPTILVFEDTHWADPSLLDLIEHLVGRCRDAPVLLLAIARPEFLAARTGWGGGLSAHTVLELRPLSEPASRALASVLLPITHKPGIIDRLVEAAGGNALFIEELAASVLDRATEAAQTLPATVQAIITARLDGLPAEERRILLDAAVVGLIFWPGALARMGHVGPTDELLDSLERRDLIRRRSASRLEGEVEFAFKHALIRDVAYSILPRVTRRERHATVARFLEELAGDRVGEVASLLAHHWEQAGQIDRAVDCLLIAAGNARRAWAKGEAITLYTRALDLLPAEATEPRQHVLLQRAITRVESGDFARAASELDALLPDLHGSDELEGMLARGLAAVSLVDDALDPLARRATEVANALGEGQVRALALRAYSASIHGRTAEAIALGDQWLDAWQPGAYDAQLAIYLGGLGLTHYLVGGYERALELCRRGYELGLDAHGVSGTMFSGGNVGMALAGLGRHEEALALFEEIVALGREVELPPWFTARALNCWAGVLRELHDTTEARRLNEEAMELAARIKNSYAHTFGRIDLLSVDIAEGQLGRAQAAWPGLWETALAGKGLHRWLMRGRLATARAEIALAAGDHAAAAEAAVEAIEHAQAHGRLKYEAASRLVLGSALLHVDRRPEAIAELRRTLDSARRLGHPPFLAQSAAVLARALVAVGADAEAEAAHATARRAVEGFAASLSQKRRARFLSAPPMVAIVATPC